MLTEDEKAKLNEEKRDARSRMIEQVGIIDNLASRLSTHRAVHAHWKKIHEKADRKLAEDSKLRIIRRGEGRKKSSSELLKGLDKEGIMRIARLLKIEIKEETLK